MHYVPILKFKQGEWQALGGPHESLRSAVTRLRSVGPTQGQTRSRWATSPAASHHLSLAHIIVAVTPRCYECRDWLPRNRGGTADALLRGGHRSVQW